MNALTDRDLPRRGGPDEHRHDDLPPRDSLWFDVALATLILAATIALALGLLA